MGFCVTLLNYIQQRFVKTMKCVSKTILLFVLLSVAPLSSAQQQRYISDELTVPIRAGASTRYKILRMVASGSELELMSADSASGYSKIRLKENGLTGFVLSRYIVTTPSARNQLDSALAAVEPLQSKNTQLEQDLTQVQTKQQRLVEQYEKLRNTNQRLNQELAQIRKTAANALAIDERNTRLEQKTVEIERALQIVQQENQALRDTSNQTWFLYGAGVIVMGMLLGLLLPKLRLQRRNRWGEL